MRLRRLTDAGTTAFRTFIADLRERPTLAVPTRLLEDPATSESLASPTSMPSLGRSPSRHGLRRAG